jgi:hypothetical protein
MLLSMHHIKPMTEPKRERVGVPKVLPLPWHPAAIAANHTLLACSHDDDSNAFIAEPSAMWNSTWIL